MQVVTKGAYPTLYSLLEAISYDNGMVNREQPLPASFLVPYQDDLRSLETAAEDLDGPDRITLCCGEETDQRAISARSPELTALHDMLNAWFDGGDNV